MMNYNFDKWVSDTKTNFRGDESNQSHLSRHQRRFKPVNWREYKRAERVWQELLIVDVISVYFTIKT